MPAGMVSTSGSKVMNPIDTAAGPLPAATGAADAAGSAGAGSGSAIGAGALAGSGGGAAVLAGATVTATSPPDRILSSTRRLSSRPSSVWLSATGIDSP